ncbi:hypothetical protein EON67_03170 [archaeon]|nr:MAG: hypothetical protein EON67_03170 [archaeon]
MTCTPAAVRPIRPPCRHARCTLCPAPRVVAASLCAGCLAARCCCIQRQRARGCACDPAPRG